MATVATDCIRLTFDSLPDLKFFSSIRHVNQMLEPGETDTVSSPIDTVPLSAFFPAQPYPTSEFTKKIVNGFLLSTDTNTVSRAQKSDQLLGDFDAGGSTGSGGSTAGVQYWG